MKNFAEIGVWRGEFAEHILRRCPSIEHYYMVDPWRHLDDWNKPANVSDPEFDQIFSGPWIGPRLQVTRGLSCA